MRKRVALSALAVGAMLACTDDSPSPTSPNLALQSGATVSSIQLSPTALNVTVGQTPRIKATTIGRVRGWRLPVAAEVEWFSDDPSVAVVEDGLIVPLKAGTARIVARSGKATAIASAYVKQGSVRPAGLTVTPDSVLLERDSSAQLTGKFRYSNGVVVTLRKSLGWRSLDTAVVKVTSTGRVTARACRRGLVVASIGAFLDGAAVNCKGEASAPPQDTVTAPGPVTPSPLPTGANSHFVAPGGSRTGSGRADRPWDLATALAQPSAVQPGDTIWLRGGTYKGEFVSRINGTASAPVVVRQVPGERATIDGRLQIEGSHTWYWGFEVMSSDAKRVSAQAGAEPTDLPRYLTGLSVTGSYIKLINLVAHDLSQGVFANSSATGLELSGNLIYHNGWLAADGGKGHNLYLQNDGPTKSVLDNVMFGSFGAGLHIYGSEKAVLRNFRVEGNTIFESGEPAGGMGGSPPWNIVMYGGSSFGNAVFRGNSLYHRNSAIETLIIGTPGSPPGNDIQFVDNVVQGFSTFNDVLRYTVTGNRFTSGSRPLSGGSVLVALRPVPGQPLSLNSWNNNRYAVAAGSTQLPFALTGSVQGNYLLPQWKSATGYDGNSTMTDRFTGTTVIVRPSKYEKGRAFVTVWNWDRLGSVAVDLSQVLSPGDEYEIRHVYDAFGAPITSGTYRGGSVSVPQTSMSAPVPVGYRRYGQPLEGFGVFLVTKKP